MPLHAKVCPAFTVYSGLRGEFMQLKFDGLLNETMTLLNGLGTMKSSIRV